MSVRQQIPRNHKTKNHVNFHKLVIIISFHMETCNQLFQSAWPATLYNQLVYKSDSPDTWQYSTSDIGRFHSFEYFSKSRKHTCTCTCTYSTLLNSLLFSKNIHLIRGPFCKVHLLFLVPKIIYHTITLLQRPLFKYTRVSNNGDIKLKQL